MGERGLRLAALCGRRAVDNILDEIEVVVRYWVRVDAASHLQRDEANAPDVGSEGVALACEASLVNGGGEGDCWVGSPCMRSGDM